MERGKTPGRFILATMRFDARRVQRRPSVLDAPRPAAEES